ncbi:unnamed protein product [Amoebophrya sp. A25]|nr:unnamed protein product [Amoebophrya sp. A25]|eukprot:GSA25T00007456001.1
MMDGMLVPWHALHESKGVRPRPSACCICPGSSGSDGGASGSISTQQTSPDSLDFPPFFSLAEKGGAAGSLARAMTDREN